MNKINNPQTLTPLLKAAEIAEICNVSKAYVYKLMKQGVLPSVQIGYAKRVRQEDLHRFIRDNRTGYQIDV